MIDFAKVEQFCKTAHSGQRRKGGEPYYLHPIAVRNILVSYGVLDENILAAALLHDVLEDTLFKYDDIVMVTNTAVANIVVELTRIDPPNSSREERNRTLNAKARTFSREATYVKLADRLHNNSSFINEQPNSSAALRYARETLALLENIPHTDVYNIANKMAGDLRHLCNEYITNFK